MPLSVSISASSVSGGVATLTATGSGGTAPYSYAWTTITKPTGANPTLTQPLTSLGYAESLEIVFTRGAENEQLTLITHVGDDTEYYNDDSPAALIAYNDDNTWRIILQSDDTNTSCNFDVITTGDFGNSFTKNDGDGDTTGWSIIGISNLNSMPIASATMDVAGSYTFRCTVTDATAATSHMDVTVVNPAASQTIHGLSFGFGLSVQRFPHKLTGQP